MRAMLRRSSLFLERRFLITFFVFFFFEDSGCLVFCGFNLKTIDTSYFEALT